MQSHVDPWMGSGNAGAARAHPSLPDPSSSSLGHPHLQLINSPALIVRVFVLLQSRDAESSKPPLLSCSLTLIPGSSQGRDPPLLPGDVRQHLAGAGISARPQTLHIWARFVPSPRDTGAGELERDEDQGYTKGTAGQQPDLDLGNSSWGLAREFQGILFKDRVGMGMGAQPAPCLGSGPTLGSAGFDLS